MLLGNINAHVGDEVVEDMVGKRKIRLCKWWLETFCSRRLFTIIRG